MAGSVGWRRSHHRLTTRPKIGFSAAFDLRPPARQAPGQNPAVDFTATGSAVGIVDKNGRAFIDATTNLPNVSAKAAGCPNGNWEVIVGDVIFYAYSFTITQGNQTLFTCTGSFGTEGSSDGDSNSPTCTEG